MNEDKVKLELDADQQYKLMLILGNYLDALTINESHDPEIEEIRKILSHHWAKRFD